MATHSSILAWIIPGTEEPVGLPSMGLHRVRHDWRDLPVVSNVYKLDKSFLETLMDPQLAFGFISRILFKIFCLETLFGFFSDLRAIRSSDSFFSWYNSIIASAYEISSLFQLHLPPKWLEFPVVNTDTQEKHLALFTPHYSEEWQCPRIGKKKKDSQYHWTLTCHEGLLVGNSLKEEERE